MDAEGAEGVRQPLIQRQDELRVQIIGYHFHRAIGSQIAVGHNLTADGGNTAGDVIGQSLEPSDRQRSAVLRRRFQSR